MLTTGHGGRSGRSLTTANSPGGVARHFRIQVFDDQQQTWKMYGSYLQRQQAEQRTQLLLQNGVPARLVEYTRCPTAA